MDQMNDDDDDDNNFLQAKITSSQKSQFACHFRDKEREKERDRKNNDQNYYYSSRITKIEANM